VPGVGVKNANAEVGMAISTVGEGAGVESALGTPCEVPKGDSLFIDAKFRAAARGVGRGRNSLSNLPPFACAADTTASSWADASGGTIDKNPMRGGSTEGCVKLP